MAKIIPDLLLNFSATCLLVGRLLGHNPHHAAEKGSGAGLGDGRAARKTGSQKEQRNLGSHFTPLSRFDPYHTGLPCQLLLRRRKDTLKSTRSKGTRQYCPKVRKGTEKATTGICLQGLQEALQTFKAGCCALFKRLSATGLPKA